MPGRRKGAGALEERREAGELDFAGRAEEILEKGLRLLDRRFTLALEQEEELGRLIQEARGEADFTQGQRTELLKKLAALQLQKIGDLTSAVSALYEKRAAALRERPQGEGEALSPGDRALLENLARRLGDAPRGQKEKPGKGGPGGGKKAKPPGGSSPGGARSEGGAKGKGTQQGAGAGAKQG